MKVLRKKPEHKEQNVSDVFNILFLRKCTCTSGPVHKCRVAWMQLRTHTVLQRVLQTVQQVAVMGEEELRDLCSFEHTPLVDF